MEWFSHEKYLRESLQDTEEQLLLLIMEFRRSPRLIVEFQKWLELESALAQVQGNVPVSAGFKRASERIRQLGDRAWQTKNKE